MVALPIALEGVHATCKQAFQAIVEGVHASSKLAFRAIHEGVSEDSKHVLKSVEGRGNREYTPKIAMNKVFKTWDTEEMSSFQSYTDRSKRSGTRQETFQSLTLSAARGQGHNKRHTGVASQNFDRNAQVTRS